MTRNNRFLSMLFTTAVVLVTINGGITEIRRFYDNYGFIHDWVRDNNISHRLSVGFFYWMESFNSLLYSLIRTVLHPHPDIIFFTVITFLVLLLWKR